MAKMKYYNGSAWVTLDAANGDSVDGLHFRINGGKLQYSQNGSTWYDAGLDTSDATALAQHILSGKTAYVNGVKITGTMPNKTGGYTTDGISRSGNELRMSIDSPGYFSDAAYLKYVENNWIEANIRSGINMFGKTGTMEEGKVETGTHVHSFSYNKSNAYYTVEIPFTTLSNCSHAAFKTDEDIREYTIDNTNKKVVLKIVRKHRFKMCAPLRLPSLTAYGSGSAVGVFKKDGYFYVQVIDYDSGLVKINASNMAIVGTKAMSSWDHDYKVADYRNGKIFCVWDAYSRTACYDFATGNRDWNTYTVDSYSELYGGSFNAAGTYAYALNHDYNNRTIYRLTVSNGAVSSSFAWASDSTPRDTLMDYFINNDGLDWIVGYSGNTGWRYHIAFGREGVTDSSQTYYAGGSGSNGATSPTRINNYRGHSFVMGDDHRIYTLGNDANGSRCIYPILTGNKMIVDYQFFGT